MAELPIVDSDVDVWGGKLNAYVTETRVIAEDATILAAAASTLAQQVVDMPGTILQQAQDAAAAADTSSDTALTAAAAAAESAALAQAIADGIDDANLPPGGTDGQALVKDDAVEIYHSSWQGVGTVTSVNGDAGPDVVLTAADIGALEDTYVAPVTSVNGDTGAVTVTAADLDAVTTSTLDGLVDATATVNALQADSHTHSNKTTLDAVTAAFTTTLKTKLDAIEAAADVTDATNVDAAGAVMNSDTSTAAMSFVVDEDDFASNTATKVPTQQSVRAYVDTAITVLPAADNVTQRVVWTGSAWPAMPVHTTPMELWSTNDPDADVPDDANLIEGDVWKRHPAAV